MQHLKYVVCSLIVVTSLIVLIFMMTILQEHTTRWSTVGIDLTVYRSALGGNGAAHPAGDEEQVRQRLKPNAQMLLLSSPRNSCVCERRNALQLHTDYPPAELKAIRLRRHLQFQEFLQRRESQLSQVLVAEPNSPLAYPTRGVEVRPQQSILIPGLGLYTVSRDKYEVTLWAQRGVFDTVSEVDGVVVQGLQTERLSLSSRHLPSLNVQLRAVTYTNTAYLPGTAETVLMRSGSHKAEIPIRVAHPEIPRLYDGGADGDIGKLVTVVTKTFLRYDKLRGLIRSIRQFYPNVTIIVADDSDKTEMVQEPRVEQYIMPFGKGWFAGRNLAISQVTTKYLLWVDDDFLFTEGTSLERMVEVLDKTLFDVVGGKVANNAFQHKLKVVAGSPEEGDCLFRLSGSYQQLDGFPSCDIVDVVVNFFMARTTSVRAVGFDPQFSRVGHTEFFIDGLGKLRVATCSDVSIGHAAKMPGSQQKYNKFRRAPDAHSRTVRALFFKNHLKCYDL
ncbi:beta-1,4 N-acetylgalactosaminyltransferase 1-like [Lampetra fluviatilis]